MLNWDIGHRNKSPVFRKVSINVLKAPLTVLIAASHSTTLLFLPTTAVCLEMRDSEQWDFPVFPIQLKFLARFLHVLIS